MRRKLLFLLVAGLTALSSGPSSAELIGRWTFDNPANLGADRSGAGNDGTVEGDATFSSDASVGKGALLLDGTDDYIRVGLGKNDMLAGWTRNLTIAAWAKPESLTRTWNCFFGHTTENNGVKFEFMGSTLRFTTLGVMDYDLPVTATAGEWLHATATFNDAGNLVIFYLNGQEAGRVSGGSPATRATGNYNVGYGGYWEPEQFQGLLDDVRIYDEVLSDVQIQAIMPGDTGASTDPVPGDGATDVPCDVVLSWTAGEFAATHDVYFGTSFDDVNAASRASSMGVLVSQGQAAAAYDPAGLLDFSQTYYWRIDEVNAAPDNTIFQGDVWSFTTEPFAYPIGAIIATSNGISEPGVGPENTINGSGLDAADQHSTVSNDMWLASAPADGSLWVQYEFDGVYKLYEMLVWNYNVQFELILGFGIKGATVEYSENGTDWTALGDVEFAKATAKATYTANTTVDFGGVAAKYVRLNVNSGWGMMGQFGLSEVRFLYIPAQAREPQPADGTVDVEVGTALAWRSGREAVSHEVYLGTDPNSLTLAGTASSATFAPGNLEFGSTYYWQIVEVNEADAVTAWAGDVWSFTTQEYAWIDDFESYTDDIEAGEAIFDTWIDGWVNDNGATVGYFDAPFAEGTIVNSGKQSMPLQYDNSASPFYSEAEREFETAQNWTGNGADTLVLYVRGNPPVFLERADGTILMGSTGGDIWNTADAFRFAYKRLSGNGSIVARVDSIANTSGWAKGGVMIRESLDPGSKHAMVVVTPGNGVALQNRPTMNQASLSVNEAGLTAPYWVKLTRTGDTLKAERSADGTTWVSITAAAAASTLTIPMANEVYIGLALVSNNAGASPTSAEFANVSTTGNVTGQWQTEDVGGGQLTSNDRAPMYVRIEDSTGKSATATSPDEEITLGVTWQEWAIPYSALSGVNLSRVQKMTIGVGSKTSPAAGGTGLLYIDDVGYGRPVAP